MAIGKITYSENEATLTFPLPLLEQLGLLGINDSHKDNGALEEIQVDVVERTLVARPISEVERAGKVAESADRVFTKYADVLAALAKGAE